MLISVVVCTYNPADALLARVLDAILAQDLNPAEWELIVVDNNSSVPVSTRPCVVERGVRVVTEYEQGLSKARACGLGHAKGSILVFVDDDNIIASDYLRVVADVFEDPRVGVVSGAIEPEYEEQPAAWVSNFEHMFAIRRPQGGRTYLTNIPVFNNYFAIGAGMAVRREVIEGYYRYIAEGGVFVPGRVGAQLSSAEDVDLDFFAIRQGYLVGTVGDMRMRHVIPAKRTTPAYLSALAVAATDSALAVNNKWSAEFGDDVIEIFKSSKLMVALKCVLFGLLSWNPPFRVRYYANRSILRNLRNTKT